MPEPIEKIVPVPSASRKEDDLRERQRPTPQPGDTPRIVPDPLKGTILDIRVHSSAKKELTLPNALYI
jgi:hypothetical protein